MSIEHDAAAPTKSVSAKDVSAKGVPLGWLLRVALTNLPFLIALIGVGYLPAILQTLVVGAILFLAPGFAWTDQRKGDAVSVLFRMLLASLAAGLVVWSALIALPGPVNRIVYIVLLAAVTNIGLWIGFRRGWYAGASPFATTIAKLMLLAAAVFYLVTFLGAAYFVPALEDQDMETQGTAYGLINELTPTMPVNRPTDVGSRLFFAHPLLLHFWIGESALVSGDLDRLRHYHEASLAARDGAAVMPLWQAAFEQFMRDPVLIPTRTPNLFLAAFIMLPLGFFVFRMTGSRIAALGSCALYATLPEVYVRSSYGGYMALTNFLLMSSAYFYVQAVGLFPDQKADAAPKTGGVLAGFSGILSGWADQKAILMALAAPPHAVLRTVLDRPFMTDALSLLGKGKVVEVVQRLFSRADFRTAFIVGASFLVGWAGFALYGLIIAPKEFIADHIVGHVASRLTLSGVEVFGRDFVYPSVTALWIEFANHSGWLLLPLAALAGVHALTKVREAHGLLAIWVLIGFIGFSLVDWRQTKHLAHLLPALAVLVGIWWASLQGHWKTAASAAIGAALLWNIWRTGLTMVDFTTIQPTPIW